MIDYYENSNGETVMEQLYKTIILLLISYNSLAGTLSIATISPTFGNAEGGYPLLISA